MEAQRAAEIQVVLEGIRLPASRDALVRYARPEDAAAASALQRLPDREYDRLDAVGEELMRTPEPPTNPPRQTIEQQTQLQQEQQERQEG